ncbi:MAG: CDP-glycerol glycerophosphotransferase family protein [Candidatus Hodarchaeota archaeon]
MVKVIKQQDLRFIIFTFDGIKEQKKEISLVLRKVFEIKFQTKLKDHRKRLHYSSRWIISDQLPSLRDIIIRTCKRIPFFYKFILSRFLKQIHLRQKRKKDKVIYLSDFLTKDEQEKSYKMAKLFMEEIIKNPYLKNINNFNHNMLDICRMKLSHYAVDIFSIYHAVEKFFDDNAPPGEIQIEGGYSIENDIFVQSLASRGIKRSLEMRRDKFNFQDVIHVLSVLFYSFSRTLNALRYPRISKKKNSHKDVLFFCRTKNHIKTLLPLVEFMSQSEDGIDNLSVVTIGLSKGEELRSLEQTGIKVINYEQVQIKTRTLNHYLKSFFRLTTRLKKNYHKLGLGDLGMGLQLNKMIPTIFKENIVFLSAISQRYEKLDSLISLLNPKLIVLFNEINPVGRILTNIANARGIFSMYIPHGAITSEGLYTKVETTKIVLDGDHDKEILVSLGTNEDAIELLGRPVNDDIVNKYIKNSAIYREAVYNRFNFDLHKKLIVLGTNDSLVGRDKINFISCVLDSVCEFNGCEFLIKLHPRESEKLHKKLLKERGLSYPIVKEINIYDVLSAADLLISSNSTIEIESVMLNKPVINVDFLNRVDYYNLIKEEVCIPVNNANELSPSIKKALYDTSYLEYFCEKRKKFLEKRFKHFDGNACQRISENIHEMI